MPTSFGSRLQANLTVPVGRATLVGTAVFVLTMIAFFRLPLLPFIGADLLMSPTQLGLLTTVFAIGRLLTDIPAGRFADRVRPGRLFAYSALIIASGSFLFAGAQTALVAYGAAFFLGVGSAITNTTGMTFFSSVTDTAHRGMALSAFSAALLAGQAIGPAAGGLAAALGTWRTAEFIAGVLGIFLLAGFLKRTRGDRPTPVGGTPQQARAGSRRFAPLPVRLVLYSNSFITFATTGSIIHTLVPIIGDANLGLSATTIGLALGLGGLARLVGALVGGQVADRVSRKWALVPGLLVQALGVGLLTLSATHFVWAASIVLLSLGAPSGISVASTIIADLSNGSGIGRSLGTFRFVGDIGLITAPVITAQLYERFGTAPSILPLAGLLTIVALASAIVIPETR